MLTVSEVFQDNPAFSERGTLPNSDLSVAESMERPPGKACSKQFHITSKFLIPVVFTVSRVKNKKLFETILMAVL